MKADAAEARARQRLAADASVAMRGDDQFRALGNRVGGDEHRVFRHDDFDTRRLRRGCKAIVSLWHDDARDVDVELAQHVECRGAEVARSHQRDSHPVPRCRSADQSRRITANAVTIIATKNTSVQPAIERWRNSQLFSAHSPLPSNTFLRTSVNGRVSSM